MRAAQGLLTMTTAASSGLVAEFKIYGRAVPQARPRFAFGGVYQPRGSAEYQQRVKQAARDAMGENAPLNCAVAIMLEEIRQHKIKRGWASVRPDLDNIIKALLDGMNGVIYQDDGQVCAIVAIKRYADAKAGEQPCVNVRIYAMQS